MCSQTFWECLCSYNETNIQTSKKSQYLIIHLRLLIKLGRTFQNPFSQCEKWINPFFMLCSFLTCEYSLYRLKVHFHTYFQYGVFLGKNLSAGLVWRPWWCYSRMKWSSLDVHVNRSLSIVFHGYGKRHSWLCCDPKPMRLAGQRRLCVWVSDLCSACFCCPQNMGLLQDELWFQEITHIVSKFACPSLTLWTAHFSCFRNILMLDFDILLPHGHITINFPLHTDRLEDS